MTNLTLQQFAAYQRFAYEYLSKQEVAGGIAGMFGFQKIDNNAIPKEKTENQTDQFAATAKRMKEKMGIPEGEKVKIPIDKVWEEMKRGG